MRCAPPSLRVRPVAAIVAACLAVPTRGQGPDDCCPPHVAEHAAWIGVDGFTGIAADGLGGVYVPARIDYQPALLVSRDDGRTWETVDLPEGPVFSVQVAAFPDGTVVIPYHADFGIHVLRSIDQARTFEPSVRLGPGKGFRFDEHPDGRLALVVSDASGLKAHVTTDRGSTWRPAFALSPLHDASAEVVVADDCVVVAMDGSGLSRAVTRATLDGGDTWTSPSTLWPVVGNAALTATRGARVQAYRVDPATRAHVEVAVSSDCGSTWRPSDRFDTGSESFVAAAGLSGNVHVLALDGVSLPAWSSRSHGEPASWLGPIEVSPCVECDDASLLPGPGDVLHAIHTDRIPTIRGRTQLHALSCDAAASWLTDERRVDLEPYPMSDASERSGAVHGRRGRIHAAWLNVGGSTGGIEYAALDPGPVAATVVVTDESSGCVVPRHRIVALTTPHCVDARYQWLLDGAPIVGATGAWYDVPRDTSPGTHEFSVEIACGGVPACGGPSARVVIDVVEAVDAVTDTTIDGLLRVEKSGSVLLVAWQERAGAPTGHSIYAGTVPQFCRDFAYDHSPLACAIERVPSGAIDIAFEVPVPPANAYYLVAPATCVSEGVLGTSSAPLHAPRPLSVAAPACGPLP